MFKKAREIHQFSIGSSFLLILFHVNSKNQTMSGHLRYTRSSTFNYGPYHSSIYPHHSLAAMGSPYYHRDMEDPISPALPGHHRSRSASRPPVSHTMDYPSESIAIDSLLDYTLTRLFQERDINPWIEVAWSIRTTENSFRSVNHATDPEIDH